MPSPAVKRRRIHGPESSAANRNKSLTELEVYDDFEGAHTPRSSGKKTLSGRWAKNGMDDGRQGRLAAGTNTSSWAGRRNLDNDAHAGDVQHEEAVRRHRSRRSLRKSERLAMIQQQNGSFRQERDRAQRKDEGQNARADTGELEHARSNLRGHAPTPTKAKSKSSRLQRLRQLSSTATPATASHDNPTPMRAGRLNGSAREDSNRAKRASPLSDFDATSGVEDLSDFKPVTPSVRRRASARRQARNEGLNGIDTMNVDSGSILANEEDEEDGEEFYDAVTSPLDPSDQLHSEADAAAAHLGDVEMSGTLDTPKKSKRDMKGSPAAHGTSSRADRLEMATKAAMTDLHETTMDSPKRRGRPPKPGATSTASAEVNETEMQVRQSTVASPGLRDGRNGTGQQRKESLTAQTNGEISSHHADEMDLDQDELDHGIDEAPERKTPFYTPRTRSARRETGSAIPSGAVDGKNFGTTPLGNGITLTSDHAASVSVEKGALELIHHIALSKLTGRRPIPLQPPLTPGPYDMLHSVLLNTILSGEGNSLMVIGPSGSGKSALVDAALRDVAQNPEVLAAAASTDFGLGENHVKGSAKKKRGKATRPDSQHQTAFHVVRLDGLIHTDDKIAVHDIWRQLGREVELQQLQQELEADVTHEGDAAALDVNFRTPHSHADTLAMLLALLSHPDEHERALGRHIDPGAPRRVAQAVIFVLSSFERFATHGRQKLLYNLLDVAQSRKAPVCVVGLTTRVDVSDMMEKRVKSRFGHRYIHCSLPKSLGGFADVCKAAMRVEKHELSVSERELLVEGNENDRRERIAKVHFAGARKGVGGVRSGVDWLGTWNGAVEVSVFRSVRRSGIRVSRILRTHPFHWECILVVISARLVESNHRANPWTFLVRAA